MKDLKEKKIILKKEMTRRQFLGTVGVGVMALSFASCNLIEKATEEMVVKQPNVLFIAIDDFTPKHWGSNGGKVVKTPNVNALARDSVNFTNAYCSSPACLPSRQSLIRGLLPSTTGVFGNFTPNEIKTWKTDPSNLTMYSHFQANGYRIVSTGKVDHGIPQEHVDERLDKTMPYPNRDKEIASYNITKPKKYNTGTLRFRGKDMHLKMTYGTSGLKPKHDWDYINASRSIKFLDKKTDKPFFLAVGLTATHAPFCAPKKYHDMYPINDMKLPFVPKNDRDDMINNYEKRGPYPPRDLPDNVAKEMMSSHFACMTFVDDQIGRIIAKLKEQGTYKDTIIVLWTDHGSMVGEHGIWSKGPLLEDSVSAGLMFKVPKINTKGTVCKKPVESIDIFATLADICGLGVPKGLDSVSMKSLLENPKSEWKDGAMITSQDVHEDNSISGGARMLVTEEYSFVKQYIGNSYTEAGAVELYDLKKDPNCFTNVANNAEYNDVLRKLEKNLDARYKPYKYASRWQN